MTSKWLSLSLVMLLASPFIPVLADPPEPAPKATVDLNLAEVFRGHDPESARS